LLELVEKGIEKHGTDAAKYGSAIMKDCIIREIDTYIAFNSETDAFVGELIKED